MDKIVWVTTKNCAKCMYSKNGECEVRREPKNCTMFKSIKEYKDFYEDRY
jgi:hypothetical protein